MMMDDIGLSQHRLFHEYTANLKAKWTNHEGSGLVVDLQTFPDSGILQTLSWDFFADRNFPRNQQ